MAGDLLALLSTHARGGSERELLSAAAAAADGGGGGGGGGGGDGGGSTDAWRCLVSQYLLPYIKTPLFVLAAAYDDVIAVFTGDAEIQCAYVFHPACSALSLAWWEVYSNATRLDLAAAIAPGGAHGLYLTACAPHCSSITFTHNDTWTGLRSLVDGAAPADAFDEWLRGGPSRRIDAGAYGDNLSCLGWHG